MDDDGVVVVVVVVPLGCGAGAGAVVVSTSAVVVVVAARRVTNHMGRGGAAIISESCVLSKIPASVRIMPVGRWLL